MANARKIKYNKAIAGRQKRAREGIGLGPVAMAIYLDVPLSTYQRYETNTPIPHYLIERFCLKTGLTIEELITGNKPAKNVHPLAAE